MTYDPEQDSVGGEDEWMGIPGLILQIFVEEPAEFSHMLACSGWVFILDVFICSAV